MEQFELYRGESPEGALPAAAMIGPLDPGHDRQAQFSSGSPATPIKHEYCYRHVFGTKTELSAAEDNWMTVYSHERGHSAIGMRSPIDYEHTLNATTEAS